MAGIDAYTLFAQNQNLTMSVAGTDSTNILDLNQGLDAFGNVLANPDIGMGKAVFVDIEIGTAAAGATATSQWQLMSAPDASTTTDSGVAGSWTTINETGVIPMASLAQGYHIHMAVPPYAGQYLKLTQITGTAAFTAGSYSAWLSGEPASTV